VECSTLVEKAASNAIIKNMYCIIGSPYNMGTLQAQVGLPDR
jgi:hypothetical protein